MVVFGIGFFGNFEPDYAAIGRSLKPIMPLPEPIIMRPQWKGLWELSKLRSVHLPRTTRREDE